MIANPPFLPAPLAERRRRLLALPGVTADHLMLAAEAHDEFARELRVLGYADRAYPYQTLATALFDDASAPRFREVPPRLPAAGGAA